MFFTYPLSKLSKAVYTPSFPLYGVYPTAKVDSCSELKSWFEVYTFKFEIFEAWYLDDVALISSFCPLKVYLYNMSL